MKKAALLLLLPLFQQCTTAPSGQRDNGLDRTPFHHAPSATSLDGVKIPTLHSPALAKRWGKPEIAVTAAGGYHLHYSKPGNHFESLDIYAAPGVIDSDAPEAPLIIHYESATPQPWQTFPLAGRPTHVFIETPGGGDTPAMISTVTFPVAHPGKPAASYRVVATSNHGEDSPEIRSYLTTVSF